MKSFEKKDSLFKKREYALKKIEAAYKPPSRKILGSQGGDRPLYAAVALEKVKESYEVRAQ